MTSKKSGSIRPKAKKTQGTVLRINYDGETWDIPADENDIPAATRMALYSATRTTFTGLRSSIADGQVDTFMVGAFLFLARHMAGERVTPMAVINDFDPSLLGELEVVDPADDEGATRPEA